MIPKVQFSLGNILVAILVCAFLVMATFVPKGYLIYLPLSGLTLLAYSAARILQNKNGSSSYRLRNFVIIGTLFAMTAIFFASIFNFAVDEMARSKDEVHSRIRALDQINPEELKMACLELHSKLICKAPDQRTLNADSSEIPESIKKLRPRLVIANPDSIFIKMALSGSGIAAYPKTTTQLPGRNLRVTKLAEHLFYWNYEE